MAKETSEPEQKVEAPEPKKKFVQYLHAPNVRGLTSENLAELGLEGREPIWWDASNDWRLPLDSLGFPDQLAAVVFTHANGFRIVED